MGVEPAMNAKPRDIPGALDETIDFLQIESGPERPEGSHDMPRTTPQGQQRYTFTSGCPAARRLHDQAGRRPGGVRRGLLRHQRLRQGGRAQADHPEPRHRASRRRPVHEPEVSEPAGDPRHQVERLGRHLRRHGVRRRPEPRQRPGPVPRRDAAGRGPRMAQGAGRRGGVPPRPRDRPPRPQAREPVHGRGRGQDRRLRPLQDDLVAAGQPPLREHRHLPLHGPRDLDRQVQQADRHLCHRRDPLSR